MATVSRMLLDLEKNGMDTVHPPDFHLSARQIEETMSDSIRGVLFSRFLPALLLVTIIGMAVMTIAMQRAWNNGNRMPIIESQTLPQLTAVGRTIRPPSPLCMAFIWNRVWV